MYINPDWLNRPSTQRLMRTLTERGGTSLFVGGCVRDALIGVPCDDIDIATSLHPHIVTDLCEAAGMAVKPTGIEHGTVTVICLGDTFEVTTFRRDVSTDGRRATVEYAATYGADAARRDFTINALYADAKGLVIDGTGKGLADLMQRRVRFIGKASDRIREDYLRILRYFRFYARFGEGLPDGDTMEDIFLHQHELFERVSEERIWAETKKILSVKDPVKAVGVMRRAGILSQLLPGSGDTRKLSMLVMHEGETYMPPRWQVRYVALCGTGEVFWKCSNQERRELALLAQYADEGYAPEIVAFRTKDHQISLDSYVLWACGNTHSVVDMLSDVDEAIRRGKEARCPLTAQDLLDAGIPKGPEIGTLLRRADRIYVRSDFTLTKDVIAKALDIRLEGDLPLRG
ncbi:tRNA nucleotidyltransferase [Ruegeria phage RpAliso]|nr:tRNA nucleotidyltransferase [Ruegeria phage RpAliso]